MLQTTSLGWVAKYPNMLHIGRILTWRRAQGCITRVLVVDMPPSETELRQRHLMYLYTYLIPVIS